MRSCVDQDAPLKLMLSRPLRIETDSLLHSVSHASDQSLFHPTMFQFLNKQFLSISKRAQCWNFTQRQKNQAVKAGANILWIKKDVEKLRLEFPDSTTWRHMVTVAPAINLFTIKTN